MIRTQINRGWEFRPKVNRHAEMAGLVAEWTPVTLPHDAMIGTDRSPSGSPQCAFFPGGMWEYRTTVDVPAEATTVILLFEGVYRDAVVSVSGSIAAHHAYGYSPFLVPIGHLVRPGEPAEVAVTVRAGDDSRWYSGAGIHRDVWLLHAGAVHLAPDRLEVRTPEVDDSGATVVVSTVVRNDSPSTAEPLLRIEIVGEDGATVSTEQAPVTAFAGESVAVRRRLFVRGPKLWDLEQPNLYRCRVTLLDGDRQVDDDGTTFGIRTLTVDPDRGLRINGRHVDLRGACVHHDNGPLGAAAISRAEVRRVELLKAAGFNAIRSAHNPLSTPMLQACDRLGMLVMDETFDMWQQPKSDDDYALRFDEWWAADTEAMVRRDINHPSVIMYSIGNEIPDGSTPAGVHLARALADKVRAIDDTRLVTQAVSGMMVAGPELMVEFRKLFAERRVDADTGVNTAATNLADLMSELMVSEVITAKMDEAMSHLDVAGYNYMSARFAMDGSARPNRVIVGSETHPTKIGAEWPMVVGNSYVVGDFTWTGWDYLGEVGIGRVEYTDEPERPMSAFQGDYPWLAAWCGDIDITGHRRPQSFYREIVYGLRRDPYIAVVRPQHQGRFAHPSPWSWSDTVASWSWPGFESRPVVVEVYADADEVELLVNGRSVGTRPAGTAQEYRTQLELDYEPGELEVIARRDGGEIGRTVLRSAGTDVRLIARAERDRIAADPADLAYVTLCLEDGDGVVHVTADRQVRVALDGPGELLAVCSANPATEEPLTGTTATTFDGRALAIVRPAGPGTVTLTASADGCQSHSVRIDIDG